MSRQIPKSELAKGSLPPKVAYQIIKDEMALDGIPLLNCASFVTTTMEEEAEKLMLESSRKNFIDIDEYPRCNEINERCIDMIGTLWNVPSTSKEVEIENSSSDVSEEEEINESKEFHAVGTSCIGSSEAIMLAVLAMKKKWQKKRKALSLSTDKPNLVVGSNAQVCWKKAMMYFEIEARFVPVTPECLVLTPEGAKAFIDENTIGVAPILGSTFNGEFEDVQGIHDMICELNKQNPNWDIPIHVDAASGGFIAPFIDPDRVWDFRLPNVKSINASGHKFGLVTPGLGWLLFREKEDLPEELVFHVNYLGGDQASFTLNFSRSASNVIGQYYNFLRLGFDGFKTIMTTAMSNAEFLRQGLIKTGLIEIVDKAHMPLVAFKLKESVIKEKCGKGRHPFTVFDISEHLRTFGWIVPAYTCPHGAEDLAIMRVVVKENFSYNLAELLLRDFNHVIKELIKTAKHYNELEMSLLLSTPTSEETEKDISLPISQNSNFEGTETKPETYVGKFKAVISGKNQSFKHIFRRSSKHNKKNGKSKKSTVGIC